MTKTGKIFGQEESASPRENRGYAYVWFQYFNVRVTPVLKPVFVLLPVPYLITRLDNVSADRICILMIHAVINPLSIGPKKYVTPFSCVN